MRMKDKVAIVTGAGSGIGRAAAVLLAKEGASVVVADINDGGGMKTVEAINAQGGEAIFVHADVSKWPDAMNMAQQTMKAFGKVNALVNNAGVAKGESILDTDEATWNLNLDVVLRGTYLCSKALLPEMFRGGGGSIVNISSVNGLTGLGEDAYSAAKAGVIALTRNLAVRYGSRGVRVNAICPGTIHTEVWEPYLKKDPAIFDRLARWYPLGRVGRPEEIAQAVLFLASDESSFTTGAVLVIDGGFTAGMVKWNEDMGGL